VSATPPGKHRDSTSSFGVGSPGGGGISGPAKIAIFVGLVAAAAIAIFLFTGREEEAALPEVPVEETASSPTPTARLACPLLQEAEVALDAGDEEAFRAAVHEAARVAQRTLDTSGESFGPPERVAIELDFALQQDVDIETLRSDLERGLAACSDG
jgi:hypothetical protein